MSIGIPGRHREHLCPAETRTEFASTDIDGKYRILAFTGNTSRLAVFPLMANINQLQHRGQQLL